MILLLFLILNDLNLLPQGSVKSNDIIGRNGRLNQRTPVQMECKNHVGKGLTNGL